MDLFTVGQRITLYFQKETNMVEMVCTIDKIYDDRLDLILPQYFMRYIGFLKVGSRITAKAFSKFGTVDFNTVVITSPLEECFTVELDYNALKLTAGEKIPPVKSIDSISITYKNETIHEKSFEISTEYVKFSSYHGFDIGMEIDCVMYLPQTFGNIKFKASITEIDEVYDNEYTAEFITMTEKDRQNLLYYMYVYSTSD